MENLKNENSEITKNKISANEKNAKLAEKKDRKKDRSKEKMKVPANQTEKNNNLLSALNKINAMQIESTVTGRSSDKMYKFEYANFSEKECKQKRTKKRNELDKLIFAILHEVKIANVKTEKELLVKQDVKSAVNNFISFYKETYVVQNFTLQSFYRGSTVSKILPYSNCLEVIKLFISLPALKVKK